MSTSSSHPRTSSNTEGKCKGKGGRPQNEIWTYFTQGDRDLEGHASATCNYCQHKYTRGNVVILQGHIANHCMEAPISLVRKYQESLEEVTHHVERKEKEPEIKCI